MWPEVSDELNKTIGGRYVLKGSLGAGGFGEVFRALDSKYNPPRAVALKLMYPQYLIDENLREDMRREANSLARFNHPNILRVLDFDFSPMEAYIVTELAEGGSLAKKLRATPPAPLSLPEIDSYLRQIAAALDEAHAKGIIHRDIKPENILLDSNGRPLLADFGLALIVSTTVSLRTVSANYGTPEYTAPEVWEDKVGKSSDIYGLGILLFQMLTGELPYQGSLAALIKQHLHDPVPSASARRPDLPRAMDDVLAAALAKDPAQRPKTATELYRRFQNALSATPAPVSPVIGKLAPLSGTEMTPLVVRGGDVDQLIAQATPYHSYNQLIVEFARAENGQNWLAAAQIGESLLKVTSNNRLLKPRTANAYARQGQIYLSAGDNRAEEVFRRALELDGNNAEYYFGLARSLGRQGRYSDAVGYFNEALSRNPDNAEYYGGRAENLLALGNYQEAIADLENALFLRPFDQNYFALRGKANYQTRSYPAAVLDFETAVQLASDVADFHFWLGRTHFALAETSGRAVQSEADFVLATRDFDEAIRLDTNQADYYYWRGLVLSRRERHNSAISDLSMAIGLQPERSDFYELRGWNWYKRGGIEEAIQDYTQAIFLNPANANAYFRRGQCYKAKRNRPAATADFEQAARLGHVEAAKEKAKGFLGLFG
jgi:serine/threonine protein kinase/Tfp pilus assembly protein PilF